jgi:hypothetical protein
VRPLLAACVLALAGSLGACSSDSVEEAAADGAVATYADGSTEQTDTSSGSDSQGDGGATATDEEGPLPGTVVVTYWHWDGDGGAVEAAGFVDAWVEDGGTCSLTLTRDGTVLSGDGPALSDANTTSCGTLRVPVAAGNGGDWQAVLAYESPAGRSSSEPFTVTVP